MATKNIEEIVKEKRVEAVLDKVLKDKFKGKLISRVEYLKISMGTKVIIYCARPRLVLGKSNENMEKIKKIVEEITKSKDPIIEVVAVENPLLDSEIVADLIAAQIERYGNRAIRRIMQKVMDQVMQAGGLGIEVRVTGKVIGDRSSTIREQRGYIKKSGELNKIIGKSIRHAKLSSGVIGIQVRILKSGENLPDRIKIKDIAEINPEELEKIDPSLLEKISKENK
ncbi:MAG: KH domain-containing protein [Nanopusillaceae archaeon]|jgi:small subunit ribosomal protein S3